MGYQWKRTDFVRRFPEQGNVDAQLNLGDIYARGDGVPENLAEDVKWVRFAAGRDTPMPNSVSMSYDTVDGVPVELKKLTQIAPCLPFAARPIVRVPAETPLTDRR